jgi:adenylyl-sulfate kinase
MAACRQDDAVSTAQFLRRESLLGQRGTVIWITGLPGSGKSTLALATVGRLLTEGHVACRLDGDEFRSRLSSDLGFTPQARHENVRRAGEVAAMLADAGLLVTVAMVSPYADDRTRARDIIGAERFILVHLDVPITVCEQRDPKGLYRRARAGELPGFTGISAPFERPDHADLSLDTSTTTLDACVAAVVSALDQRGRLRTPPAGSQSKDS